MTTGERIHRRLLVEELEPRVAPAQLQWVGDVVTLHQGDSVAITSAQGGDFDGDRIDIVLDSLTGDNVDTTAELYIRRALDPEGGGGYYIAEMSFAAADANTRLTVYVGGTASTSDTGTFVGNINDDRAEDADGNPLPLVIGTISVEGTVGDVRLGGIGLQFRSWGIFTSDGFSHFDEDGNLVPYTLETDSVNSIILDGSVGFDGEILIEPTGPGVGPVLVGVPPQGDRGSLNILTIDGGDFGQNASVDVIGSIRHFTLSAGDMLTGSTLKSHTGIGEIAVYGSVETGVTIDHGIISTTPAYPGYGCLGTLYVAGDFMTNLGYQSSSADCPLYIGGTLGGDIILTHRCDTIGDVYIGKIGSGGSLLIGGVADDFDSDGIGTGRNREQYVVGDIVIGAIDEGGTLWMRNGSFYQDSTISILGDLSGSIITGMNNGGIGKGGGRIYGTLAIGGDITSTGLIKTWDQTHGAIDRLEVEGSVQQGATIDVASSLCWFDVNGDDGFTGHLIVGTTAHPARLGQMRVTGGDLGGTIDVHGYVWSGAMGSETSEGIVAFYNVVDADINVDKGLHGFVVHGNVENDVTVTAGYLVDMSVLALGPLGGNMAGEITTLSGGMTNVLIEGDFSGLLSSAGSIGSVQIDGTFMEQAIIQSPTGTFSTNLIVGEDLLGQVLVNNLNAAISVGGSLNGRLIATGSMSGVTAIGVDISPTAEISVGATLGTLNVGGDVANGSRIAVHGSWVGGGSFGQNFDGNIDVDGSTSGVLSVGGDFTGALNVTGNMGATVNIAGDFLDAEIVGASASGTVRANSFSGGQLATGTGSWSGAVEATGGDIQTEIRSAAGIGQVIAANDLLSNVLALNGNIGAVSVGGDIAADVLVSATSGHLLTGGLTVGGQILGSIQVGSHSAAEYSYWENGVAKQIAISSAQLLNIVIDGTEFGLDAAGTALVDLTLPAGVTIPTFASTGITYRNLSAHNITTMSWAAAGSQVSVAGTITLNQIDAGAVLEFEDLHNLTVTTTGMTDAYMRVHGDLSGTVIMNGGAGQIPSYDPNGGGPGVPRGLFVDGQMTGHVYTGVTLNNNDTYTFVELGTPYTFTFTGRSTEIDLNGEDRYSGRITLELHDTDMANQTAVTTGLPGGFVSRNIRLTGATTIDNLTADFRVYGLEDVTIGAGGLDFELRSHTNIGAVTIEAGDLVELLEAEGNDGTDGSIASVVVEAGRITGTVRAKGDMGAISATALERTDPLTGGLIETMEGDFTGLISFRYIQGIDDARRATLWAHAGSFIRNMDRPLDWYRILEVSGTGPGEGTAEYGLIRAGDSGMSTYGDILGELYFSGDLLGTTIEAVAWDDGSQIWGGRLGDEEWILTNGLNDDADYSGIFDEVYENEETNIIHVVGKIAEAPLFAQATIIHAYSLQQRIITDSGDGFDNIGATTLIDIDGYISGRIQATTSGGSEWGKACINLEVGSLATLHDLVDMTDNDKVIRSKNTWLFIGDSLTGTLNIYGDVSGDIGLGLWQTGASTFGTFNADMWIGGMADETFDFWACQEISGNIAIRRLEGDIYLYQATEIGNISANITLGAADTRGSDGRGRILIQQSTSSILVDSGASFTGDLNVTRYFDYDNSGGPGGFGIDTTQAPNMDEGNFLGRLLVWNGGSITGTVQIDGDLGTPYARLDSYGQPYEGLISAVAPKSIGQYNSPLARGTVGDMISIGNGIGGGKLYGMVRGHVDVAAGGYNYLYFTEDSVNRWLDIDAGAIDLATFDASLPNIAATTTTLYTTVTANGVLRDFDGNMTFDVEFETPVDTPWRVSGDGVHYSLGGVLRLDSYSTLAGDLPIGDMWVASSGRWLSEIVSDASDIFMWETDSHTRPYNLGGVQVSDGLGGWTGLDLDDAPTIMVENSIVGARYQDQPGGPGTAWVWVEAPITYTTGTLSGGETFVVGQGNNHDTLPSSDPLYLVTHTVTMNAGVGSASVSIHGERGMRIGAGGWMDDANGIGTIWLDTGAGQVTLNPWDQALGPTDGDIYVTSTGYFADELSAQRILGYVGTVELNSFEANEEFAAFNIGDLRIGTSGASGGDFNGSLTVAKNLANGYNSGAMDAEKITFEKAGAVNFGGSIVVGANMFNTAYITTDANTSDANKNILIAQLQQDLTLNGGTFSGLLRAGNEIGNFTINGDMNGGSIIGGNRVASVHGIYDRIGGILIRGNMIDSEIIAGDDIATEWNLQVQISSWGPSGVLPNDATKQHIGMDEDSIIRSLSGTIAVGGVAFDRTSDRPNSSSELKPEDLVLTGFWGPGNLPTYYSRGVLIRGGGSLNGTLQAGGIIGQISIKHATGDGTGTTNLNGVAGPGGTLWVGGFGPNARIISDTMRSETIYIQGPGDRTLPNLAGGKGNFEGQLWFVYESPTVYIGTPAGRYNNTTPIGGDMRGTALIHSSGWDLPFPAMTTPSGGSAQDITYQDYSQTVTGQIEGDIVLYNGSVGPNVVIEAEGNIVGWVVVGSDNSASHSSPYGGNFYGTLRSINGNIEYGIDAAGDFGGTIEALNGSLGNGRDTLMDIEGSVLPGATIWAAQDINGNIYVGVDSDTAANGEYVGGPDAAYALATGDLTRMATSISSPATSACRAGST